MTIQRKLDRSWVIIWAFCALVIAVAIGLVQIDKAIAEEQKTALEQDKKTGAYTHNAPKDRLDTAPGRVYKSKVARWKIDQARPIPPKSNDMSYKERKKEIKKEKKEKKRKEDWEKKYLPGSNEGKMIKAQDSKFIQKKKWWSPKKLKSSVDKLKADLQFISDAKAGKLSPSLMEKAKTKMMHYDKNKGLKGSKEKILER